MTDDSIIQIAEDKMARETEKHSSPWIIQITTTALLLVIFGPVFAVAVFYHNAAPNVNASGPEELVFFASVAGAIIFYIWTMNIAKEAQWLGVAYNGSTEWSDSIRIAGKWIDYGELKKEEIKKDDKPAWELVPYRKGKRVDFAQNNLKEGMHLWGIPLLKGGLPELDVILPSEGPDKCLEYIGHQGYGFVHGLPWTVRHISFASYLRLTWTEDPDGTVVPIGMFTEYDLMREQLRAGLEPRTPVLDEVKVAVNTRDNYYRDKIMKSHELALVTIENLKGQLKEKDKEITERLEAYLDAWDKGGKRHKPKVAGETVGRKTRILTIAGIITLFILGALALLGRL